MTLKVPSPCCGSPTLLWIADKGHYQCPCGEMKVNEYGQVKKKRGMQSLDLKNKRRPTMPVRWGKK